MSSSSSDDVKRHSEIKEISELCQEALKKLGPGHFRARVLLEMTIIQLAVDAPDILQSDRQGERSVGARR